MLAAGEVQKGTWVNSVGALHVAEHSQHLRLSWVASLQSAQASRLPTLLVMHPPVPTLQDVINASFARSASTEQALLLLRQFESLLARDSFRADLDAKYLQAFQVGLPGWAGY